ncbi:ferredoxin [Streptosporangium jomthongense]|uniref:Ferredoxin n=2 Tax=Streptosporangium TaxID=2000 RepID=A0ABV8F1H4_9ACTN
MATVAGIPVRNDHRIGGERVGARPTAGTVWVDHLSVRGLKAPIGGARGLPCGRFPGAAPTPVPPRITRSSEMKVIVDMGVCKDHGQCVFSAPEVFRLDENGRLAYEPDVDEALRDAVEEAADVCPLQAITVEG